MDSKRWQHALMMFTAWLFTLTACFDDVDKMLWWRWQIALMKLWHWKHALITITACFYYADSMLWQVGALASKHILGGIMLWSRWQHASIRSIALTDRNVFEFLFGRHFTNDIICNIYIMYLRFEQFSPPYPVLQMQSPSDFRHVLNWFPWQLHSFAHSSPYVPSSHSTRTKYHTKHEIANTKQFKEIAHTKKFNAIT